MTRAAIFALLAVCVTACNRLDQSRARSTAQRLESKHLGELRHIADMLDTSCKRPPGVSPVAGTSLDSDPAVAEVEVACREPYDTTLGHPVRLRGTNVRLDAAYFELGVGKNADAGFQPDTDAEETVTVPSRIVPSANDLCVHRPAFKICVAYRD